ncbi:MAG TPA: hypothetical protein VGK93_04475 [Candidatus Eisenbacteria bacterium]|jgi:hypothetical protein
MVLRLWPSCLGILACLVIGWPSARALAASPLVSLRSLRSPAPPGSGEPSLAVAPDGAVFLSWLEKRGAAHALRVSRLEGQGWRKPGTIAEGDSFFVNWADCPVLLAVDSRRLAIAWPWKSGGATYAYDVRIAQSQDGGRTWSRPTVPHRDGTPTEHGFISLVASPASPDRSPTDVRPTEPMGGGGVRAIWLDGRKAAADGAAGVADSHDESHAEMTLRTALLSPEGTLYDERELDGRVCDCCQTAAVVVVRGLVVAYRDRSPDEIRDISVVRLEDGRWSEPHALHPDGWKIQGCPVNGPSLDARGHRVAVAWYTMAADSARVLVSFSSDGGRTFDPPIRVDDGDPLGRTDVVLLEDGSALVVWLETQGQEARILGRGVTSDGSRSPAFTVARTAAARSSGFPRTVRSGRRLIFAWTDAGKPARVRVAEAEVP